MKKYFEIFLVVIVIFYLLYFLLYKTYLPTFCGTYSYNNNLEEGKYIVNMSSCKDTLVCDIIDVNTDSENRITSWQCDKKNKNLFELDYYKNIFKNYIN